MTQKQIEHVIRIRDEFNRRVTQKYVKGATEHKTDLHDRSALDLIEEAINETIDQFVYLTTAREKLLLQQEERK